MSLPGWQLEGTVAIGDSHILVREVGLPLAYSAGHFHQRLDEREHDGTEVPT